MDVQQLTLLWTGKFIILTLYLYNYDINLKNMDNVVSCHPFWKFPALCPIWKTEIFDWLVLFANLKLTNEMAACWDLSTYSSLSFPLHSWWKKNTFYLRRHCSLLKKFCKMKCFWLENLKMMHNLRRFFWVILIEASSVQQWNKKTA